MCCIHAMWRPSRGQPSANLRLPARHPPFFRPELEGSLGHVVSNALTFFPSSTQRRAVLDPRLLGPTLLITGMPFAALVRPSCTTSARARAFLPLRVARTSRSLAAFTPSHPRCAEARAPPTTVAVTLHFRCTPLSIHSIKTARSPFVEVLATARCPGVGYKGHNLLMTP